MSVPPVAPVASSHRIAVIDGVPTHWWEYGARHQDDATGAPEGTLVLVHGFRGTHEGLAQIAAAASRQLPDWSIAVPDLPGFGRSPAPAGGCTEAGYGAWLAGFCGQIAEPERPFVLLGHSFGSIVAAFGLQRGLGPDALVLVNPISQSALEGPNRLGTQAAIGLYAAAARLPQRAATAVLSAPPVVRVMSEVMAKTRDRELRRWIHRQHAQYFSRFSSARDVLDAFRTSCEHTVAEAREQLGLPVLMLCGERDDIVNPDAQRAFAATLPDVELRLYPGVGHLVHYEAPQAAADETVAFIRRRVVAPDAASQGIAR